MAKTRIYLDVDGVINAIPAHNRIVEFTQWDSWNTVNVRGYWITYADELLRALEGLHAEDDVEVVWLTTWRELAVSDLSPAIKFDATQWRVVSDGDVPTGYRKFGLSESGWGYWWKASTIAHDLTVNPVDRVVWLDDDSSNYINAVHEVKAGFPDIEFFIIGPDTSLGLTRKHITAVQEFIGLIDTAEDSMVS